MRLHLVISIILILTTPLTTKKVKLSKLSFLHQTKLGIKNSRALFIQKIKNFFHKEIKGLRLLGG